LNSDLSKVSGRIEETQKLID